MAGGLFVVGGVFFLILALAEYRTKVKFVQSATEFEGQVVGLQTKTYKTKDGTHTHEVPVVQYHAHELLEFVSEVSAQRYGLSVGSKVQVLVDPTDYKIAKLKQGVRELKFLIWLFGFLGVFSVAVGVHVTKQSGFDWAELGSPQSLFFVAAVLFLAVKCAPFAGLIVSGKKVFMQNAYPVKAEVKSSASEHAGEAGQVGA